MNSISDQIFVKSHVARDLLQSAGLFKTDKLIVWEYVANSLQYVDHGISPIVRVVLDSRRRRISIMDNGRGMDWPGLKNFFVMHGENLDRKEGRIGRGRFGTGKSAAFGIADLLRITTAKGGKRSAVELTRTNIELMTSDDPIPVTVIEKEQPSKERNGTMIEIEGIHLKTLDQNGIIRYIERHMARCPKNVTVLVNNHQCEFSEPPIAEIRKHIPANELREILGECELTLKVSMIPLEEDLRGVSIYSNGVWYETSLGGSEGRELAQYIFGEIDVPKLDDDKSPIAPFDMSRSMKLNPSNDIVRAIYAFIGQKIEEIRKDLVKAENRRKSEEETRRLKKQASEIAEVINEDFQEFRHRVAKVKALTTGAVDRGRPSIGGGDGEELRSGNEVSAKISEIGALGSSGSGGGGGGTLPPFRNPLVEPTESGQKLGKPSGTKGERPKSSGGFRVEFKNMGIESHRAQYEHGTRTLFINLDHPQLIAARGSTDVTEPLFKRLSYEIAFSEYAIALARELQEEYLEPSDAIFDIRETLNRVARKAARLYAEPTR